MLLRGYGHYVLPFMFPPAGGVDSEPSTFGCGSAFAAGMFPTAFGKVLSISPWLWPVSNAKSEKWPHFGSAAASKRVCHE
jgi:hypothetical protein